MVEVKEDLSSKNELLQEEKEKGVDCQNMISDQQGQIQTTNDTLKLSKVEIQKLNETIACKDREIEEADKDKLFFKGRVERLEDKLLAKEKLFL